MDPEWQHTFHDRMRRFEGRFAPAPGDVPISIKVRVSSGCFHREHSPRAYALIDQALAKLDRGTSLHLEEHESGPELLVYIAATTAAVSLATAILNLVATIIKSRSDGIKRGDHSSAPLELIVRRMDGKDFREEIVLRIGHTDTVDGTVIGRELQKSLQKLCEAHEEKRQQSEPKGKRKR